MLSVPPLAVVLSSAPLTVSVLPETAPRSTSTSLFQVTPPDRVASPETTCTTTGEVLKGCDGM